MKNCKFNSMEMAEFVHSKKGTQAIFICKTQNDANLIGARMGLAARRYDTEVSYKSHMLINQATLKVEIMILATVDKAGRELKPRGRKTTA